MKFSTVFVLASVLASEALIAGARPFVGEASSGSLNRRAAQSKFGNKGGQGANGGAAGGNRFGFGNKGTTTAAANKNTATTKSKATSAAAVTTTAAASTSSTAAAGGKGGKGGAAAGGAAGAAAGAGAGTAAASSGNNNNNGGGDLQTSLELDPKLIGSNLAQNGQNANGTEAGQVASLTSANNFINFCDTVNVPITNGLQVSTGSCNPVPMGVIPAKQNVPSCAFVNPPNGGTIKANQNFTIEQAIRNMETGNFVNPDVNYFAAPQQVNGQGLVIGHGHVVVEAIPSLASTTPTDPTVFAFFKGLNDPAQNGILSATVAGGLPAGTYKVSSINTAANHQPVLGPVAQHGSFDCVSFFTVA